jgi:hypothetical protein
MNEEKGKRVETSYKREKLVGGGWQNCKVSWGLETLGHTKLFRNLCYFF